MSAVTANQSHNDPGDYYCLGTKSITLRDQDSGAVQEGLVAIFHPNNSKTQTKSEILRVVVTDGNAVYQGEIEMKQVKMKLLDSIEETNSNYNNNNCNGDKTTHQSRMFAGYLLHNAIDQVKPSYVLQKNEQQVVVVKLVVKYYYYQSNSTHDDDDDDDAAMKKAWSGVLAPSNSNDRLSFFKLLGDSINQGQRHVVDLQDQTESLQADRNAWKDTAEKLQGSWQNEKDTLFHNFSRLYNETRREFDQKSNQVKDLNRRLQELLYMPQEEQQPRPKNNGRKRKTKTGNRNDNAENDDNDHNVDNEMILNQPDDNDRTLLDDDMVDALAAGKSFDIKSNRATIKKRINKESNHDDREKEDDATPPPKKKAAFMKTKKWSKQQDPSSSDDSSTHKIGLARVKAEPTTGSTTTTTKTNKWSKQQDSSSSDDSSSGKIGLARRKTEHGNSDDEGGSYGIL